MNKNGNCVKFAVLLALCVKCVFVLFFCFFFFFWCVCVSILNLYLSALVTFPSYFYLTISSHILFLLARKCNIFFLCDSIDHICMIFLNNIYIEKPYSDQHNQCMMHEFLTSYSKIQQGQISSIIERLIPTIQSSQKKSFNFSKTIGYP